MSLLKLSGQSRTDNPGLVFGGCTGSWSLFLPQYRHGHHWLQAVLVLSQIQGSSLIYTTHFSLHRYPGAGLDKPTAALAVETWGQLMGQPCCRKQPRANLRSAAGTSLTPGKCLQGSHTLKDIITGIKPQRIKLEHDFTGICTMAQLAARQGIICCPERSMLQWWSRSMLLHSKPD